VTDNNDKRKIGPLRIPLRIQRISWRDLTSSLGVVLLLSALSIWVALHFVRPAPPDTITIASGPEGSSLWNYAERYRKILARNGVKLKIRPSEGTLDNLKRLSDPKSDVEIGFVQGGLSNLVETARLVSLGSVFYEPLTVFYRGTPLERLSGLKGRRIAIGREGSGARSLALTLLKANDIDPKGATRLLDLEGKDAAQALLTRRIDAAFLMGDSATPESIRELMHSHSIRLFDFVQADAYVRRFRYLSKLELPAGSLDLGRNTPPQSITLIAPTVELIARPNLHPALSDLLIEAAREVHGRATRSSARASFRTARARVPDQRRRGALLQVGQGRRLSLSAVLGREPRGPCAGRAAADHPSPDPGLAPGPDALQLARQGAHLPPLRGTDGAGARGDGAADVRATHGIAEAPR
jgi:TRAP-type uncharacterized transport system substrate-binding protein